MHVLLTSNDLVRLNFLTSLLRDAGISAIMLDHQVSTMEGSIGAVPRRLAVSDADAWWARHVLEQAGEV
jgi:hypothetical protein